MHVGMHRVYKALILLDFRVFSMVPIYHIAISDCFYCIFRIFICELEYPSLYIRVVFITIYILFFYNTW